MCVGTVFGRSLEQDAGDDTSGDFRKLLNTLLTAQRPDGQPADMNSIKADATTLYQSGQGQVGTDETRFNAIFCGRSSAHLRAVFEQYNKDYGKDIDTVIKSEFSGFTKDALLTIGWKQLAFII